MISVTVWCQQGKGHDVVTTLELLSDMHGSQSQLLQTFSVTFPARFKIYGKITASECRQWLVLHETDAK